MWAYGSRGHVRKTRRALEREETPDKVNSMRKGNKVENQKDIVQLPSVNRN